MVLFMFRYIVVSELVVNKSLEIGLNAINLLISLGFSRD